MASYINSFKIHCTVLQYRKYFLNIEFLAVLMVTTVELEKFIAEDHGTLPSTIQVDRLRGLIISSLQQFILLLMKLHILLSQTTVE